METVTVPSEVTTTLRAAGYAVRGPAGVGSGGPVWTAVRTAAGGLGDRVVVHPVARPAGADGVELTRRLDALCALDHPHLARVVDVLVLDEPAAGAPGGRDLLVLVGEVPGTTLAALLTARGSLPDGEVVTLTVPLAGALDTLHRAGLVHGDVSPGNVVVRPDGCPVLIDLLGTLVGPGGAGNRRAVRGTPGFVAPEVAALRGRAVLPGAPADVFGLATVALAALDPAAIDGPLGQELAAACAPDPVLRPTAGELAAGCWARATAAPIGLPDAGVLARTALAQLAAEHRTVSVDRRSRHRATRPARRRPTRRALVVSMSAVAGCAAVALAGTVLTGSAPALGPTGARVDARAQPLRDGASSAHVRPATRPDPVAAAVALTERRAEVLAAGDPAALGDVVRDGGPAHAADLALMARLAADGVRLEGPAAADVTAVPVGQVVAGVADKPFHEPVDTPPAVPPPGPAAVDPPTDRVDVAVTSGVTAHRRRAPDGVVDVPAQPPRTVTLTLVWTTDGWRVESVRAP